MSATGWDKKRIARQHLQIPKFTEMCANMDSFYARCMDSLAKKTELWPILQILTVHTGDLNEGGISTIYLRERSIPVCVMDPKFNKRVRV